uniref:Uncharacterized protein n=1 Tax=Panagrolaimus sp. PS1159 TaxID=55785 RepID=A0AC35FHI4_9BILA
MDNPNFASDAIVVINKIQENDNSEAPLPLNKEATEVDATCDANIEKNRDASTQTSESQITITPESIANWMKPILNDPANLKLVAIVISIFSMMYVTLRLNSAYQVIPSLVINCFSLFYSIYAIFVTVIVKNEEKNSDILKKVFGGRNIYWHEFHSTMTLLAALGNLSFIVFDTMYSSSNVFFSLTNTMVFGYEFYLTTKTANLFVTKETFPKCNCKIVKGFLGLFQRYPTKFNILKLACFIAAFVLYLFQSYRTRSYFIYCSVAAISGSSIPILLRLTNDIKWYSSSPKTHTYFSIGITLYAFLAVLTNSVDVQYDYRWYWAHQNFPTISPISFSISCIIFALSLFDLYSQAIFNKSHPIIDSTENPSSVKIEQRPLRNLPTIIENPLGIEGVKEVYEY